MEDRLDRVLAQDALDEVTIAHVTDDQLCIRRNRLAVAAQEVVEHDDLVAGLEQALGRGAADIAGTAGDQDSHSSLLSCCWRSRAR